jgi:tetratricopeptide (TPR) repeat protein
VDGSEADAASRQELESIIAAHPESLAMRLALADLYFDDGDYSASLPHYLGVLEGEPTPLEESRALGRIGWMAYLTGQTTAAADYLEASLEADPDNGEGKLFLAVVLFEGSGDAAGAIPLLEEVLAIPGLPDDMRQAVGAVLDEARSVLESP